MSVAQLPSGDASMAVTADERNTERPNSRPLYEQIRGPVQDELARRFQAGDRGAGEVLLLAHDNFIRVASRHHLRGADSDDVYQEARIGFLDGVEKWDANLGGLLTIARFHIRHRVNRHRDDHGRMIRVPCHIHHAARRPTRMRRREVPGEQRRKAEIALWMTACISMDSDSIAEGDTERTVAEMLADDGPLADDSIDESVRQARIEYAVRTAMAALGTREQDIVRRRFLVDEPETLESVGATMGVTGERIRQLEEQSLRRMRERLDMSGWDSFEDWLEFSPFLVDLPYAAPEPKRRGPKPGRPLAAPTPMEATEPTTLVPTRSFGEALRAYRRHEQMPQTQIAKAVGVVQYTVSRWEHGGAVPEVSYRKLCGLSPELAAAPPPPFTTSERSRSGKQVPAPVKRKERRRGWKDVRSNPVPLDRLLRAARALGIAGDVAIVMGDSGAKVLVGSESWAGSTPDAAVEVARQELAGRLAEQLRRLSEAQSMLGGAL